MDTIPQETNGILENLIAGFFFWCPNLLLFLPVFRDALAWVLAIYNFVMIFVLISVMSHFRFNIRYTKNDSKDQSYSQTGKFLKEAVKAVKEAKDKAKTAKKAKDLNK